MPLLRPPDRGPLTGTGRDTEGRAGVFRSASARVRFASAPDGPLDGPPLPGRFGKGYRKKGGALLPVAGVPTPKRDGPGFRGQYARAYTRAEVSARHGPSRLRALACPLLRPGPEPYAKYPPGSACV